MTPEERRIHFRQGLSTLYLPYYDELCKELDHSWAPYFGVRTFLEQDQLYAKGRTTPPLGAGFRITNARGGESPHQYGCATDWTWFDSHGSLVWLKKDDPKWQVYIAAVRKVGLKAGVDFGDIDHNELPISASWKHVLMAFKQTNMTGAQQFIEARTPKLQIESHVTHP